MERIGRATRTRDAHGETWRFPREEEETARTLVAMGARGVGGFTTWGVDGDVWVRREAATLAREHRDALDWREAIGVVRALAEALAACEEERIWPGALTPSQVAIAPPFLLADAWVASLAGHRLEARAHGEWTPPEQAAGAPWDGAANRYVLGLIAYRMLAGKQPFEGLGLRRAIAEQASGAPPFDDAIARALKPGVQSFVLAMLAGDAHARPRNARDVARRCEELLGDAEPILLVEAAIDAPSRPTRVRARRIVKRTHLAVPAAIGAVGVVAAAFAQPQKEAAPHIRERAPLTSTRHEDCAPCHAREVAEWERSAMAQSVRSPLFGALESLIEEQVGKDDACPNGAGILRRASTDVCRSDDGIAVTGAGGEHWCVSCHAPGENLRASMPAWSAHGPRGDRAPVRDLLSRASLEGISCATCHQTVGPVDVHARARGYEGNATWTSLRDGTTFFARPEDATGRAGIGNSGYRLDPGIFIGASAIDAGEPIVHRRILDGTARYLASSEMCGACHDVRLFGTDAIGVRERGEHFKRLRNAYSEWRVWSESEARAGRRAPTCQGCHMSEYPGVCVSGAGDARGCPSGTHFEARSPREVAGDARHYFTSVDLPLADDIVIQDEPTLDTHGLPVSLRARRDLLLARTFAFSLEAPQRQGDALEIPVRIANTGAGHRVPAGFSQEREIWVELTITDARGAVVYSVGHVRARDEDLHDKTFTRINVDDANRDARGRPLGLFGADVIDGPDAPAWSPTGRAAFRGKGLINLQNGFLRCVKCIGIIDGEGRCQPGPNQGRTRADRFDDGAYDADTGECRSNLRDGKELFETYFPIGALDAERGLAKGPDAIIDTRSAAPGEPIVYTYTINVRNFTPPFHAQASLHFRAFPPYLVRAFAAYEARMDAAGARPSGPQVSTRMMQRLDILDIGQAEARIP